jgi:hypothetical protein
MVLRKPQRHDSSQKWLNQRKLLEAIKLSDSNAQPTHQHLFMSYGSTGGNEAD